MKNFIVIIISLYYFISSQTPKCEMDLLGVKRLKLECFNTPVSSRDQCCYLDIHASLSNHYHILHSDCQKFPLYKSPDRIKHEYTGKVLENGYKIEFVDVYCPNK